MKIKTVVIQTKGFDAEDGDAALQHLLRMIDIAAEESFEKDLPNLAVLPECAWPGYFIGYPIPPLQNLAKLDLAVAAICGKAKEHHCFIIAGLPEIEGGNIYNSAYLIDDMGAVIGTVHKSLLWHFDRKWFSPGQEYQIFDLPIGKIGVIVCADGRQPEIIRILSLQGAELIIDVANWVSSGKSSFKLSNPQYEYMLPCRAIENKVWCVVANKVGMESSSIVFCGKSCIISPDGAEVAVATSYEEDIISAVIDLAESHDKRLDDHFNVTTNRQPPLYKALCTATASLPLGRIIAEPVRPDQHSLLLGVGQLPKQLSYQEYVAEMTRLSAIAARQRVELLVLPGIPSLFDADNLRSKPLEIIKDIAKKEGLAIVSATSRQEGGSNYKCAVFADSDGQCNIYEKTHLTHEEAVRFKPGDNLPVFATRFGNIGIIMDYEGLLPEITRILMLNGADLVCWLSGFANNYNELFAKTRAAENRLFFAVANSWEKNGGGESLICNPQGQIAAQAFTNKSQLITAQVDLSLARCKTVVSGTNVYTDRLPQSYSKLLEEA